MGIPAEEQKVRLRGFADLAQASFARTHEAREQAFKLSRDVIRHSANCIRATHRGELAQAQERLDSVASLVRQMESVAKDYPAV